jgi:hypothetical protein
MKSDQEFSLVVDQLFVIANLTKRSFLCMEVKGKDYFLTFSSRELAQKYWDESRTLESASIIEIDDRIFFLRELSKIGNVAIDPVREDEQVRSFYELEKVSSIAVGPHIGQA